MKEKLKTLKDLEEEFIDEHNRYISKELRQEAIKWIKHFKEMSERDCLADNNDKIVCYPEDQCDVCEMSDWYDGAEQKFMEFFNITEEELK